MSDAQLGQASPWSFELEHMVAQLRDETIAWVVLALVVVYFCRNYMEIMQRFRPAWSWFLPMLVIFVWTMFEMGKVSEFLYFQF